MRVSRTIRATGVGIATLGALVFAVPGVASAQDGGEAAEYCRELDEAGVLEMYGVTRGECVNLVKGPASENSNNYIAAFCGIDFVQEWTGTTNKGQCIKVVRSFSGV